MARIIGIDLGTTFSAMAATQSGEARIIENKEGARTTPSVVALSKNDEILVGVQAKRQQVTNPQNTIFQAKRLIGRRYKDETVQKDMKWLPYEIRESEDGGIEIKMGEKWYKPLEISAMVLRKFKQDAEERFGEKVTEAIITVPAYFDDSQRKATKAAGEIAGLDVKRVINEPTAAALAYGLNRKKDEQIVVYDFGGGTFDISILEIAADNDDDESRDTITVKATGGDSHLGGEDFDQRIIDWLVEQYNKDEGIDLSKDHLAVQRLKESAEKAKIELSSSMETEINIPFITSDASGPKHLIYKITRAQFENMVKDLIERSMTLVKNTMKDAGVTAKDIDEIVLVGGQTRMPSIHEAIKQEFGKDPNRSINPDEVVAIGAATQGGILSGDSKEVLLLDVTPLSLGIETLGGVNTVLIPKNTTIPTSKSQTFSTATDNQTSVDVHVVQGERPMVPDNKSLGRFVLEGIPTAPRGTPQIEVTFDIDANGILSVTALDKATNKSQSIRIEGSTGLSDEEIERLRKEAEAHAEEDKKKQELIEAKNAAENIVYTAEKSLREAPDTVSDDIKKDVQEKVDVLKEVKDGEDIDQIKQRTEKLSQSVQKIGQEMYSSEQEVPEEDQEEEENNDGENETEEGQNK